MISLARLRRLEQQYLITLRVHPEDGSLLIANYTPKCQYSGGWSPATELCRGLVLRTSGGKVVETVALPFRKFFNVGENGRQPSGKLVAVTEKVDGSLGILYRHAGRHKIATRGSFGSEQALWATEFLQTVDLRNLPTQYTLLFEIVFPQNRIVIDYGNREDLVLLGIRDRYSGADLAWSRVQQVAKQFGFSLPKTYSGETLENLLKQAESLPADSEGWVLRFSDGRRWKVKGKEYFRMARMLSNFSRRTVLEAAFANTVTDWPDEVYEQSREWEQEARAEIQSTLEKVCAMLAVAPKSSRKEFALWVLQNYREDAALLFGLYDGKDIVPLIQKRILEGC